jgi:hypothetical protein
MTLNFEIKQVLLIIETFKYLHLDDSIENCLHKELKIKYYIKVIW